MAKSKNKKVKEIKKELEEIEETEEELEEVEEIDELEVEDEDDDLEEKKSIKKKIKKIIEEDEDDEIDEEYEEITVEERLILIEKKITFILVFLVIIAIMTFVTLVCSLRGDSATTSNNGDDTIIQETTTYDTSAFKEIKGTDIEAESKNETIVVMVGRQSCGYCAQFAPVLEQVSKEYGITARYIDLAKILDFTTGSQTVSISDESSYNAIVNLSGKEGYETFAKDNFGYTPVTMIIKNNKVIAGVSGNMSADSLEELFKTGGLSK